MASLRGRPCVSMIHFWWRPHETEIVAVTDWLASSPAVSVLVWLLLAVSGCLWAKRTSNRCTPAGRQRGGISILPFIVAGLFRAVSAQSTVPCAPLRDSSPDVPADGRPDLAAAAIRRGNGTVAAEADGSDEGDSGYEADSGDDRVPAKKGTQFD